MPPDMTTEGLCSSEPCDLQESRRLQQAQQEQFFAQMERLHGAAFDVEVDIGCRTAPRTPPTPPLCPDIELYDADSDFFRAQQSNYTNNDERGR